LDGWAYELQAHLAGGGKAVKTRTGEWRLSIPEGAEGAYRLAQLDDYSPLPRGAFRWQAPLSISLRARASSASIPGTWGFGLWNDPFSMGILGGGGKARLPALPNTAWFFFAAPPNYLSLRDDLPAQGWLAATFRSPRWPLPLLVLGLPALPLLLLPPAARLLRRLASGIIRQDAAALACDPSEWHLYSLEWVESEARFRVDGDEVLRTGMAPMGRLGLVLWVDNQYMSIAADGRMGYGTLANPEEAWVEIGDLEIM
jgi:hypothetical protein